MYKCALHNSLSCSDYRGETTIVAAGACWHSCPMADRFAIEEYIGTPEQIRNVASWDPTTAMIGDRFTNDVLKPLAQSAVIEPVKTVAQTINRASEAVGVGKLFAEPAELKYEPAAPYTAAWFTQSMAGGLGALIPYTVAGKLAGGAMRSAGARLELAGATGALMRSEKAAFMAGAFAYDGLRPLHEGETRLGNAVGGAAGFYVFGVGNEWSAAFTPAGRLAARAAAGFVGADTHATVSKLISQGKIPTLEELTQAGVSGATMNIALPAVQDYTNRKLTEWQATSRFGAPVDRYLDIRHGNSAHLQLDMQALLSGNGWARVRVRQHADFDPRKNTIDVSKVYETPGAVAKGLEKIATARGDAHEAGFRQVQMELQTGNVEQAWNQFRNVRASQELAAHQTENRVDSSLSLTQRLIPEHMALEIGAWPAPGGVSYEYRWRQEFTRFQQSQGAWRPGQSLAANEVPYEPAGSRTQTKSPEEMTVNERETAVMQRDSAMLIRELQQAGFLAVDAGGSVRDMVMGGTPKDFDIATRATPEQVKQVFQRHGYDMKFTGENFGVMRIEVNGREYEIATLRADGDYSDGRRPDSISFVNSLYEDAARRDLTMNAMFRDPTTGTVYDFFGGQTDIAQRRIRSVGDPAKRFEEDRLRMMRVPRFASRYEGFTVEATTAQAIRDNAQHISSVAPERVRDELRGILTSKHPITGLDFMMESGLMQHVLPEVAALTGPKAMQDPVWHPEGHTWNHTREVLRGLVGRRFETMMAGLLHDIGKPDTQVVHENGRISNHGHDAVGAEMAGRIADRLKLTKNGADAEKRLIVSLVREHMNNHQARNWRRTTLMDFLSNPFVDEHIALQHADAMGTGRTDGASRSNRDWFNAKREEFRQQENAAQQLGAKPIVDGRMLIQMGQKPDPRLGEIKTKALEAQRDGEFTDVATAQDWLLRNYPELKRLPNQ